MCFLVDQLQGASTDPPGNMGVCPGVRSRPNTPGWGSPVSASQQSKTTIHKPEGDQPEATDVTGKECFQIKLCAVQDCTNITVAYIHSALRLKHSAFV